MDLTDLRDLDYDAGYRRGWNDCWTEYGPFSNIKRENDQLRALINTNFRVNPELEEQFIKDFMEKNNAQKASDNQQDQVSPTVVGEHEASHGNAGEGSSQDGRDVPSADACSGS